MFSQVSNRSLLGSRLTEHRPYQSYHAGRVRVSLFNYSRTDCNRPCPAIPATRRPYRTRRSLVHVNSFLSVDRSLEKIRDLFDFNKGRRLETLNKFYGQPSRNHCEEVLSDNFLLREVGYDKCFTKSDYMRLLCDVVLPAVPDFSWGHASNGKVDKDGYCIVTVQANGHHTGASFGLPGLPPIPPSNRHFCLTEEVHKVKVQDDKIVEMLVITAKGAGPRAMYAALRDPAPVVV